MKKSKIILYLFLLLIIILLLPLVFKSKEYKYLNGPDITELNYSEVFFENTEDNIKLAAMVFKPEGQGPFPVAILIHGSGNSRRNNKWYLSVAKYLVDNDIAVILPDKRGCEKSEGDWVGVDFQHLSGDVISAIEYVKKQKEIEYSKIGIIGMSQGGWIAPIAASKSNFVDFIAIMSGATVTTDEQLVYEEINNIEPYTYNFIAKFIAPLTAKRINKSKHQKPFVGFDPIPYWKQVSVPVFFAYGGEDKNVPVDLSIKRLNDNELTRFIVKKYPDGGHAIMDIKTNFVNQKYLSDLVSFIKRSSL